MRDPHKTRSQGNTLQTINDRTVQRHREGEGCRMHYTKKRLRQYILYSYKQGKLLLRIMMTRMTEMTSASNKYLRWLSGSFRACRGSPCEQSPCKSSNLHSLTFSCHHRDEHEDGNCKKICQISSTCRWGTVLRPFKNHLCENLTVLLIL